MKPRTGLFLMGLGVALFMTAGCNRDKVRDPLPNGPSTIHLTFALSANPNVIYAGTKRPTSEVKVVIKDGNAPVMGVTVYFSIISGTGYFYDYTQRCAVQSDENGVATLNFLGPLKTEIIADQDVWIQAQTAAESPSIVSKTVQIRVLLSPAI